MDLNDEIIHYKRGVERERGRAFLRNNTFLADKTMSVWSLQLRFIFDFNKNHLQKLNTFQLSFAKKYQPICCTILYYMHVERIIYASFTRQQPTTIIPNWEGMRNRHNNSHFYSEQKHFARHVLSNGNCFGAFTRQEETLDIQQSWFSIR